MSDGGNPEPIAPATNDAIIDAGPEHRPTAATEVLRAEVGDVQAGHVVMERAGAERVSAERLVMTNSGARSVEARSAQIDRSGVLIVNSEKAVLSNSTAVAVAVEEARIVHGAVLALKSGSVTFEGAPKVGIYAGPANAQVRPLVDAWGAAAFGAAAGATLAVLGAILRRLARGGK